MPQYPDYAVFHNVRLRNLTTPALHQVGMILTRSRLSGPWLFRQLENVQLVIRLAIPVTLPMSASSMSWKKQLLTKIANEPPIFTQQR